MRDSGTQPGGGVRSESSTGASRKVKALVMVEPAASGDAGNATALRKVPLLAIYGDYIESDARWPKLRQNELTFLAKVAAAGGNADIIDLPKIGIKGNSHMIMMDK